MPLKEHQCSSFNELTNLIDNLRKEETNDIYVLFSCKLEQPGERTTKLCFAAEDVLMEYTEFLREKKRKINLIYFRTAIEDYSKPDSVVHTDSNLRIYSAPVIIKWPGYKRLVGRQCFRIPLLSMLFEEENQKTFPTYQPCRYFAQRKGTLLTPGPEETMSTAGETEAGVTENDEVHEVEKLNSTEVEQSEAEE